MEQFVGRPIGHVLTIPELVMFSQKSERRTTSTYMSLSRNLEMYLEQHHLTLDELKPLSARDFIQQMGKWTPEEGYVVMNTAALYKKYLLSLLGSLGRIEDVKWLKANTKEVKFVSHFKVDIPTEQILKLIEVTLTDKRKNASFKPQLAFSWSVMAFDGLRPGEALGLYYSDIDYENKEINLVRHEGERYFPKAMKLGDEPRPIPLNDFSLHLLKQFTTSTDNRQERIIFISYTTFRKKFLRYAKMAEMEDLEGNKLTPHKLRHVFGHLWRNRGGDLQILQKVMRHADIQTTMIYSAPSTGEVNDAFEKTINENVPKEVA